MAEKTNAYENHEERIRKLERAGRGSRLVRIAGTAGGGALGYSVLGSAARDLAEAAGETLHGIEVANRIVKGYFSKGEVKYLGKIDERVRGNYEQNLREEHLLSDASREGIEAMQRASLKVPTVES